MILRIKKNLSEHSPKIKGIFLFTLWYALSITWCRMQCEKHFTSFKYEKEVKYQERSQNLKQFPENFMKYFDVDDAPQAF